MDKGRLTLLVAAAVESGVCDAGLLERLFDVSSIEVGEVSRDNLLHIYRRRLKRAAVGSLLHLETKSLISFLQRYHGDVLVMVSVAFESDGNELLLMDGDGDAILHRMRMFSR